MSRISPEVLRRTFLRIMREAGFDVDSKPYNRVPLEGGEDSFRNVATVGHTFIARGAMRGWYVGQFTNEGGAERNLCGNWTVLTTAEMMVWLSAVEMMHNRSKNIFPCG